MNYEITNSGKNAWGYILANGNGRAFGWATRAEAVAAAESRIERLYAQYN